MSKKKIKLKIN